MEVNDAARLVFGYLDVADPGDETELLGVGPGVAVLTLRKTSFDTTGRIVEIADVIMPGDRTIMTYETRLERCPS